MAIGGKQIQAMMNHGCITGDIQESGQADHDPAGAKSGPKSCANSRFEPNALEEGVLDKVFSLSIIDCN